MMPTHQRETTEYDTRSRVVIQRIDVNGSWALTPLDMACTASSDSI